MGSLLVSKPGVLDMRESFNNFLSRIDKNEFINYYKTHNNKDTAEYFNTNGGKVTQAAKYFNFIKSREDINKTSRNTYYSHPHKSIKRDYTKTASTLKSTNEKKFIDLLNSLPLKDELFEEYIINDTSYEELRVKYNLTSWTLDKVLRYYNIKKPRKQSAYRVLETKIEKYGEDNISNWKKGHQTRIEHYGSLEESYRQGTLTNQQTCLERYGVKSIYQLDSFNTKKKDSIPNLQFKKLLDDINIEYSREFCLDTKSFDFKVGNNLIEINPTITHNSTYPFKNAKILDKNYHYLKSKLARDNNYRCIHVWDWDNTEKIINLLLKKEKLYARNCEIKEVDKSTAKKFIDTFHLQGYAKDNIRIALFYNGMIVSIMTFGKPRYNKKYQYELIRYCSSYNIIGGAEKLFKYFCRNYSPNSIISYCDWSKFDGHTYEKLGFKFHSYAIGKHWYNGKIHITDNLLRQRGFDQLFNTHYGKGTSNEELMLRNKFVEVYDAGQATYIFTL